MPEYKKVGKRWWDANAIIDPGACNPSGIAHSLLDAIKEARAENIEPRNDEAVRIITYQLSYVLNVCNSVAGYGEDELGYTFSSDLKKVRTMAEIYDQQTEAEHWRAKEMGASNG